MDEHILVGAAPRDTSEGGAPPWVDGNALLRGGHETGTIAA